MIIETLTAFSAVKVVWEALEILHLIHVGHITGKAGYQGGDAVKNAIQHYYLKWQDQKDPGLQLVREAKTYYDFQVTGDISYAISDITQQAQAYLTTLVNCVADLNTAKEYFLKIHENLKGLVRALAEDYHSDEDHLSFSSQLLEFKSNFESFKDKFNLFSLSIEPPPRQLLYVADFLAEKKIIRLYNDRLATIKTCIARLEEIKQDIAAQFRQGVDVTPSLLTRADVSDALIFEQLQQNIKQCLASPEQLSKTMQKMFPNNRELATLCTDIAQISIAFQQINSSGNDQINPWTNDPAWFPLLTEEKRIEVGQRIFLHAMNDTNYHGEEKAQLAKLFLCQYVSDYELNQVTIELLSQELANLFIVEQIKKCEKLIQFLSELIQGQRSPETDPYGLLQWLGKTSSTQNSVAFLINILVSPYRVRAYHIESLQPKLENLLPHENIEVLIEKYRASYWGAIRKKSDQLIELPASFKTKIFPNDRFQKDDQSADLSVVPAMMHNLAELLIGDIETLTTELRKKKSGLDANVVQLRSKAKAAREAKEQLEHQHGVERIKESHRYLLSIDHSTNNLFPYLYRPDTINEVERKRQVPTVDDLLQVIYWGVDLHRVCKCKDNSNSQSNLLVDYFYPTHQNDSRMEAFLYALRECQISARPLLQLFSYPAEPLLALGSGNSIDPVLLITFKNAKKTPVPANCMALDNIPPDTKAETETFINQLDNYYNLALMRLRPDLRNGLSIMEKFKLLVQGLFDAGQDIREERFESVQVIMGGLHAVVSAENIKSINQTLNDLKASYADRCKLAKKTYRSTLYLLLKKAMDGCISVIHSQLPVAEQKQFELKKENSQFKEQVENLEENLAKVEHEKKMLEAQLRGTEDQRMQDKAELGTKLKKTEDQLKKTEDQRMQDKARSEARLDGMDEQINKLQNLFFTLGQPTSSFSVSEVQMQESSQASFFKN